jgi:5-formyltetrahydrofolate cyclo-ligase
MARVAARVISDGKRLGVSARWDAQAGADDSCATKQPRVDFLEAEGIDDVLAPSKRVVPPSASGWPEGATAGFSCNELLGAICVVPGLVFDSEGFYVGQDDGAYAHFLRLFPGYKVALVDGLQVSSNPLPHGEGDVAVDYLVTPGSVWRCHS